MSTRTSGAYEVRGKRYVLQRYPRTKAGDGHPEKYETYWRGPYVVTNVTPMPMVYDPHDKVSYTIRNLTR